MKFFKVFICGIFAMASVAFTGKQLEAHGQKELSAVKAAAAPAKTFTVALTEDEVNNLWANLNKVAVAVDASDMPHQKVKELIAVLDEVRKPIFSQVAAQMEKENKGTSDKADLLDRTQPKQLSKKD